MVQVVHQDRVQGDGGHFSQNLLGVLDPSRAQRPAQKLDIELGDPTFELCQKLTEAPGQRHARRRATNSTLSAGFSLPSDGGASAIEGLQLLPALPSGSDSPEPARDGCGVGAGGVGSIVRPTQG